MFRKAKLILTLLLSASKVYADGGGYTYIYNGADWPEHFPDCKGPNNSPIDLRTPGSNDPFPMVSFKEDNMKGTYTTLLNKRVQWVGNEVTKIIVEPTNATLKTNYFTSQYGKTQLKTAEQFNANQFHFHLQSEHTINGRRFDLEMHTVHFPKEPQAGIVASAVGVIFDTTRYDRSVSVETVEIIDNFFESLRLDLSNDPLVQEIPFGELMARIDLKNRWVYKGSLTTPPCTKLIFWNVVAQVYPIKQRHLDLFRNQLGRGANNLRTTGNFRVNSPINGHDVVYVSDTLPFKQGGMDLENINLIFLAVLVITLILACCACSFAMATYYKVNQEQENAAKNYDSNVQMTTQETSRQHEK